MVNISHHTLPMLLHYLGKSKSSNLLQISKNPKQNALIFTCIHLMLLTYLLIAHLLITSVSGFY